MPKKPESPRSTRLFCKLCPAHLRASWPISQEDPDSTLSDALEHLRQKHQSENVHHVGELH